MRRTVDNGPDEKLSFAPPKRKIPEPVDNDKRFSAPTRRKSAEPLDSDEKYSVAPPRRREKSASPVTSHKRIISDLVESDENPREQPSKPQSELKTVQNDKDLERDEDNEKMSKDQVVYSSSVTMENTNVRNEISTNGDNDMEKPSIYEADSQRWASRSASYHCDSSYDDSIVDVDIEDSQTEADEVKTVDESERGLKNTITSLWGKAIMPLQDKEKNYEGKDKAGHRIVILLGISLFLLLILVILITKILPLVKNTDTVGNHN